MTRLWIVIGALCVSAAAQAAATQRGIKAWYAFDEGAGGVLHDRSGNMNHGKIAGAKVVRDARYVTSQVISAEWDEKMDNPAAECGHDSTI